jgi:chemotaxis protein methyltransferase CheR
LNEDDKVKLSIDDFDYIANLVRDTAAIVLESEKVYLVEARLVPVARREGFESIGELIKKVRGASGSPLRQKIVEAMTTNETSFFRDITPFQILKENVLPELIKARSETRKLNIWCAASSTGQEPYTITMTLLESFPELKDWDIKFIATDISVEVLNRAREGFYTQLEINRGLPASMLVRYFEKDGAEWRVKEDLRNIVDFQQLNLIGNWPPFPKFDLIFVRNVLIYFDVETKRQILINMKANMADDAFLFLGNAETTFNINEDFSRVKFDSGSCYRLVA